MKLASNEITVDTNILAGDIGELETALSNARKQLEDMFMQITELDAMWDGLANEEFKKQFGNDYENSKNLCNIVQSLISCMEFAKEQYNLCENEVNNIVSSIRI